MHRQRVSTGGAAALLLVLATAPEAVAQQRAPLAAPTIARAEDGGFSTAGVQRIVAALKDDVKSGTIPGGVLVVVRKGRTVAFEPFGDQDPEAKVPMARDSIFRIYSMTKPITSVAAMMLVEEGRLSLADPVSKYIPEFADTKVGVEKAGADGKVTLDLVPPRRPMTVHDLMRHTSGLTYGFFGSGAVKKTYLDSQGIFGLDLNNAEFSKKLASLPLMHQPGSNWEYSQSTDVLGRVIEVASGQTLYQFVKARILDPLGMKDTHFYVANETDFKRIAEPFKADRQFGVNAFMSEPRKPVKYESGGGGMVSTALDYARFCDMLINGGLYGGKRYLSAQTLAYMTSDHLAGVGLGSAYLPGDGYGFGLGFQVRREGGHSALHGTAGDYSWGGAGGTAFWIDPKQQMYVILMMQSPKHRVTMRNKLRGLVYGAMLP